jgi:hypothetical protein
MFLSVPCNRLFMLIVALKGGGVQDCPRVKSFAVTALSSKFLVLTALSVAWFAGTSWREGTGLSYSTPVEGISEERGSHDSRTVYGTGNGELAGS